MALDITTLASTDKLSDSRGDINTNFTNIKTDCALIDQSMYIGTTAVAINRASATLNLAGIGTLGCGAITATSYDGVLAANILDKSINEIVSGNWNFLGTIGVGGTVSADKSIIVTPTDVTVDTNGTNYKLGVTVDKWSVDIASGITDTGYRINYKGEFINDANFEGTLGEFMGAYFRHGIYAGTGTITKSYGMIIEPFYRNGTVTIGYGIYLKAPVGGGTVGTEYAIYSADDAPSYLAGALEIAGDVTASGLSGNAGYYVKVDANGKLYTEAS